MTDNTQGALAISSPESTFQFGELAVRVVMRDGEPWFVAADVCAALDIANPRQAVSRLDDDEKGVRTVDTLGGPQEAAIINESGLYSLILTSRKEEAKRFKRWVTHEVLPAIRKTGGYGAAAPTPPRIDPRQLLLSGQTDPTAPLPPEVVKAIDKRAWELAGEAHELIREHLRRRAAYNGESGYPRRVLNEDSALDAIAKGDLGDALAHTYYEKLDALRDYAGVHLRSARDFVKALRQADPGYQRDRDERAARIVTKRARARTPGRTKPLSALTA